jgi:hypothetical protein
METITTTPQKPASYYVPPEMMEPINEIVKHFSFPTISYVSKLLLSIGIKVFQQDPEYFRRLLTEDQNKIN